MVDIFGFVGSTLAPHHANERCQWSSVWVWGVCPQSVDLWSPSFLWCGVRQKSFARCRSRTRLWL